MTPFLKQIADAFYRLKGSEFSDYCFVFPNKRCSSFFISYLTEVAPPATLLPATTDIDSLVMSVTRSIPMGRIEQLFILHQCYKRIIEKNGGDTSELFFDNFMPWGEMVLNDFNDVDRYLVDSEQLFKNIKYFKEISSNFLTDEQIEIINRYWRDPITYSADARMWQHIPGETAKESTKKSFFSLWMIMSELYDSFRDELTKRGLCYSGMAYRKAVECLNATNPDHLPFKQYVFVGFNALSASEEKIFRWFRDNECGDFYWDFASPAFNTPQNPANEFVGKNVVEFPSNPEIEHTFKKYEPTSFPEINIIGVPSALGQVKKAASLLADLKKQHEKNCTKEALKEKAKETAVVLPEENLCIPLVHSLPKNVRPINITMGYPMRNTPVYSLIGIIIKMMRRARLRGGILTYFHQDVEALFSHPLIRSTYREEGEKIVKTINKERIFNYPRPRLVSEYPELEPLFVASDIYDMSRALADIYSLLIFLRKLTEGSGMNHAFILNYIRSLESVRKYANSYGINLAHDSIFQLLNKLAGGETVHFSGEPLEGFQIMGLLETRALDFENLIILSMNENVFPRKIVANSFIPMDMRAAYGLSTVDRQESIFAYYFYRLLTRCKRVWLLYDSRGDAGAGEMSRYLYQLRYAYPSLKPNLVDMGYSLNPSAGRKIVVDKHLEVPDESGTSRRICDIIERFRSPDNSLYLSPSSINDYISCPLKFFLRNIARYGEDSEMKDFVDSSIYGTVIHYVLQHLYPEIAKIQGSTIFSPEAISKIRGIHQDTIEHLVAKAFMVEYYKKKPESLPESGLRLTDLLGEIELLAEFAKKFIDYTLREEAAWTEFSAFDYVAGEKKIQGHISLSPKLSLNIKGYIDRIDKLIDAEGNTTLRFVDYKTGDEPIKIHNAKNLFEDISSNKHRAKGMMQLLLYCHAYSKLYSYSEPIIPMIYKFTSLATEPLDYLYVDGEPLKDYRQNNLDNEFIDLLEQKLSPLFDPDVPFTMAEEPEKACKYCNFASLCDREEYRK